MDTVSVSELLARVADNDAGAVDAVFDVVYDELRRIAQSQLSRERPNHTLTPTALVNEAYVKLVEHTPRRVEDRRHFLSIAARAMRQVLVSYAEQRAASKRGAGIELVTFRDTVDSPHGESARSDEVLALDKALSQLEAFDPRLAKVVEFRFFGGMTQEETASSLSISVPTVKRDWRLARAWLGKALGHAS